MFDIVQPQSHLYWISFATPMKNIFHCTNTIYVSSIRILWSSLFLWSPASPQQIDKALRVMLRKAMEIIPIRLNRKYFRIKNKINKNDFTRTEYNSLTPSRIHWMKMHTDTRTIHSWIRQAMVWQMRFMFVCHKSLFSYELIYELHSLQKAMIDAKIRCWAFGLFNAICQFLMSSNLSGKELISDFLENNNGTTCERCIMIWTSISPSTKLFTKLFSVCYCRMTTNKRHVVCYELAFVNHDFWWFLLVIDIFFFFIFIAD